MTGQEKKSVACYLREVRRDLSAHSETPSRGRKSGISLTLSTDGKFRIARHVQKAMLRRSEDAKGDGLKQKRQQRKKFPVLASAHTRKRESGSAPEHDNLRKKATKKTCTDRSQSLVPHVSRERGGDGAETGGSLKRKTGNKRVQQRTPEDNNSVTKDQLEKETRRSCRREVDDLFAECAQVVKARNTRELMRTDEETSPAPRSRLVNRGQKKKKRERPSSFDEDLGLDQKVARFTEDGLRIYSEEELKIGTLIDSASASARWISLHAPATFFYAFSAIN